MNGNGWLAKMMYEDDLNSRVRGGDKWAMKEAVSYYGGSLTTGYWVDPASTGSVQNGMPTVTADRSYWVWDVAQNGGGPENPLSQNSHVAFSLDRFVSENQGLSLENIRTQRPDRSWTLFGSQPGGPTLRYINDPLNPGAVIDMRHMLIIGDHGNFMGGLIELLQWSLFQPSGFNIQDFYSNNLGEYFYRNYGTQLQENPNNAVNFLQEFLTDPNYKHLRDPYNNYK